MILAPDEDVHIAPIVDALDCIPLALELAAGRIRIFSPQQIAQRLNHRFSLLASKGNARPERHLTLRNAIDWSWQLLSPAEQHVLAQAAIFRGGFSVEAAEFVIRPLDENGFLPQRLAEKSSSSAKRLRAYVGCVFAKYSAVHIGCDLCIGCGGRHRVFPEICWRLVAVMSSRRGERSTPYLVRVGQHATGCAYRTECSYDTFRFAVGCTPRGTRPSFYPRGTAGYSDALRDEGELSVQITIYAARAASA